MSKAPKIPDLLKEIKEAYTTGKLAVFVGAGISRLYGCDGWKELAHRLVKRCFDSNKIIFKQQEILLSDDNYKKVISFCKGKLEEKDYIECVKSGCEGDGKKQNIYKSILKLGSDNIYLTTNIDDMFSKEFNGRIKSKPHEFKQEIETDYLYHLHGHIGVPNSLVLTIKEYIEHYRDERYAQFLSSIFSTYTVLFIGYGLREWEILDRIVSKFSSPKALPKFILLPVHEGMDEVEKEYFEPFDITLIPCEKETKGYMQIVEVIQSWVKQMDPNDFLSSLEEVKEIASCAYTPERGKKLKKLVFSQNENKK